MPDSPVNRGPLMLFANSSHVEFSQTVALLLQTQLYGPHSGPDDYSPMLSQFSNQNVMATLPVSVRGADCFIINTQSPPVNKHMMELFFLIEGLKTYGASRVTLVSPYLPYTRSDREDKPRRVIGLRTVGRIIAEMGCDGVLLMDPHPAAIQAYFPSRVVVSVLRAKPLFARYIRTHFDVSNMIAVAPDINSGKKIAGMASTLNIKAAIIDKRRDGDHEGKARPAAMIGDVSGKHCLIVDDEVMSGGTLIETADYCRKKGAVEVSAFITHPVLSKPGAIQMLSEATSIDRLVVTDTIPIPQTNRFPKLQQLTVADMFATAVKLIHTGQSIDRYKKSLYDGLVDDPDQARMADD